MRQVYNLFAVAVSTSASLGWSQQLRQWWLSEVWRKIWGICRRRPGHCSVVMDGSVIGAAPASRKTSRLKQYKADIVNLKWDSNSISNRWCKIHYQKVTDVKFTSPKKHLTTIEEVKTVDSELNCRNWNLLWNLNVTIETECNGSREALHM